MTKLLSGKVAIVTGGGRGIGRAIAESFAQQGAAVVVNDLGSSLSGEGQDSAPAQSVVDELIRNGGDAIANFDDISTIGGAESLVANAIKAFGQIDAIALSAGISSTAQLCEMTEDQWDRIVRVHLKGHFACTRAAALQMRKQKSGRIVHITSHVGLYGHPEAPNYAAAKAGVIGLTRSAALSLGPYGITVNAIAPSAVSRMSDTVPVDVLKERAAAQGIPVDPNLTDDQIRLLLIGDPSAVGNFAAYLCTDAAAHVNGEIFAVVGSHISRFAPWTEAESLDGAAVWTVDALVEKAPDGLLKDLVNLAPPAD